MATLPATVVYVAREGESSPRQLRHEVYLLDWDIISKLVFSSKLQFSRRNHNGEASSIVSKAANFDGACLWREAHCKSANWPRLKFAGKMPKLWCVLHWDCSGKWCVCAALMRLMVEKPPNLI